MTMKSESFNHKKFLEKLRKKNFKHEDLLKRAESKDYINTKQKITLIFDVSSVFKSHLCANKAITDGGTPVGGTVGTINLILSLANHYNTKDIICVFDGKNNAKRRQKIYAGYKEDRGKKNENVRTPLIKDLYKGMENKELQHNILVSILKRMPIRLVNIKELEADDIIAYLSKEFYGDKEGVRIIVTEDKDFYQLVDKKTNIYNHRKKQEITTKGIASRGFGYIPENIIYQRIVEGDPSDNVDGVKGIARKTVVGLIPELNTVKIKDIEMFFDIIKGHRSKLLKTKKGKLLLESFDIMERNYRLMKLGYNNEIVTQTDELAIIDIVNDRSQVESFKSYTSISDLLDKFKLKSALRTRELKKFYRY